MSLQKNTLPADRERWKPILHIVRQNQNLVNQDWARQFKKLVAQRMVTENIFIFILQYIGLSLSALSINVSFLWFATGTSCAYLFLRGYSILPGVWFGTFAAYYLAKSGCWLALGFATVLSLQTVLLRQYCFRYPGPTLIFYRVQSYVHFILFSAFLTALVSGVLTVLCYLSFINLGSVLSLWFNWWLANFNGILVFSSALITFDTYFMDFYRVKPSLKTSVFFGLLVCFLFALVFSHSGLLISFFALLILLITVYLSLCFGWCAGLGAAFLLAMILSFAKFMEAPLFSSSSGSIRVFFCQLFLSVITIISLSTAIGLRDVNQKELSTNK